MLGAMCRSKQRCRLQGFAWMCRAKMVSAGVVALMIPKGCRALFVPLIYVWYRGLVAQGNNAICLILQARAWYMSFGSLAQAAHMFVYNIHL